MAQPLNENEKELVRSNKKIMAIKAHRERTGSSLKDAKEEVDLYKSDQETYDKTHKEEDEKETQRKKDLIKDFVLYVVQEADILQNINARLLCKKEKTRSDVVDMINNRTVFANQVKVTLEKFLKEYI